MKRHLVLMLTTALFSHGVISEAQTPPPSPTTIPSTAPANASDLIARLSDPDVRVRDAAQAALYAAAGESLEQMQKAREATNDPDVQLRLDAIIVRYTENQAIGATKISLNFDNAPLKEVLDEFSKQSTVVFSDPQQDFGNESPRITIDVKGVSFWQALTALQTAGNLNILPQQDTWRVTRNFGNQLFGTNSIEAGAFLIQPTNALYQRNISYVRNGGGGVNFNLTIQVLSEPKIRLGQAAGQFKLIRAIDSNGNDLAGPNSTQSFGTSVGQNQFHVGMQMNYPKNPGDKITEITGVMKLNLARRVETFSMDDFNLNSKPLEVDFEGAKITLSPAAPMNGQPPNGIGAVILIESRGDNMILQRLQTVARQIRVFDQNNRLLNLSQFQGTTVNAQRAEFRVSFTPMVNPPQAAGPYRLVLDIPTSFREVEIPFTLRDLAMP